MSSNLSQTMWASIEFRGIFSAQPVKWSITHEEKLVNVTDDVNVKFFKTLEEEWAWKKKWCACLVKNFWALAIQTRARPSANVKIYFGLLKWRAIIVYVVLTSWCANLCIGTVLLWHGVMIRRSTPVQASQINWQIITNNISTNKIIILTCGIISCNLSKIRVWCRESIPTSFLKSEKSSWVSYVIRSREVCNRICFKVDSQTIFL